MVLSFPAEDYSDATDLPVFITALMGLCYIFSQSDAAVTYLVVAELLPGSLLFQPEGDTERTTLKSAPNTAGRDLTEVGDSQLGRFLHNTSGCSSTFRQSWPTIVSPSLFHV